MDKRIRTVLWLVGAVVALALVRFGILAAHKPDDQKLIQQSLQESIEASKEGRPGGVMDFISDKFKINNVDPGTRAQIANFIKNSKPDVKVIDEKAVITGDEARIVSPVDIDMNWLGQRMTRRLNDVTITFKKEDATQYLVIPTRKWRLIDVQITDEAANEFMP